MLCKIANSWRPAEVLAILHQKSAQNRCFLPTAEKYKTLNSIEIQGFA